MIRCLCALRQLPDLNTDNLRDRQIKAITAGGPLQLGKPRALVQMATGSGKLSLRSPRSTAF
jgi:type I restriction enzyme R subunit